MDSQRQPQANGTGATVLQFRRRTPARPPHHGPIVHPLHCFDEIEDRRRMRENIAAAVVVVLLVASGFWLIDHLRTSAHIAVCVEAGHLNCIPLDLDRTLQGY